MCEPEEFEPQEHDELAAKVFVMINEEVEAKIKSTVDDLEYSKKRNGELQGEVYKLRKELRDFESEKQKSLKEKEKEVMREIFEGFTIGDSVFYPKSKYIHETCGTCNGSGTLEALLEGKPILIKCMKNCSSGKLSKIIYSPASDVIRSVHLEKHADRKFLNCYLRNEDCKREMISLFKTMEECQTYCDENNKPKEE